MAKTAFRHKVQDGQPYTVPAGKLAIFSACNINGPNTITIGGVEVGIVGPISGGAASPSEDGFTANAGDVVGRASGGGGGQSFGIYGFLYDV